MGARKRAGKSEKLLSAGIIHGPFLGAGGLPRPPAVMCRAESSARASWSGVSDGRLQVIIIAAARSYYAVWVGTCGWCADTSHSRRLRMPARTPVLSVTPVLRHSERATIEAISA
jgi:hypothetical protein